MLPLKNTFYSINFILLLINSTFISKCTAPLNNKDLPYKLSSPAKEYILQHKLTEVSGLSFISDNEVALIQDEDGTIFYFNLEKGTISRKITFAKDGDYEDLKILGDTAYIIRSDGTIFEVLNLKGKSSDMIKNKYKTGLAQTNDTEGMCYDYQRKLLLIACKGSPGIGDKKYKNKKAVYSFDPATKKLSAEPVTLIDANEVENKAYGTGKNIIERFMRFYRDTKQSAFLPSGISIHPFTHEMYVISSVSNLMVVMDTTGKVKNAVKLSPREFKQPEGIAFDSAGNLYISNEGRNGKGNILKFLYLKN
ncbi:MAG TPA: SdiA-regulated domain-containing protein [Bacteroidia bacterium]|nr:SdiA-regulated domain-containing protein [Bacteroidia bacterium]